MKKLWILLLSTALMAGLCVSAAAYEDADAPNGEPAVVMETEPAEDLNSEEASEGSVPEETSEGPVPEEVLINTETEDPEPAKEESVPASEEAGPAAEEGDSVLQEELIAEPAEESESGNDQTDPAPQAEEAAEGEILAENTEDTEEFRVEEANESELIPLASVRLPNASKTYTGKAVTQTKNAVVTAVVDGEETVLTLYKNYSVSYRDNVEVGAATAVFTGKGNYTGTIEKTFKIIPPSTTIKSITPGTKCFAVKWAKKTDHVRGYHVQYALKSDFSDKTNIYIKDNTTVSSRITGLTSGKKYYVRVRTFLTVDGVNYYSKWSAVQTIKLAYNTMKVTGSGTTRTVTLMNPKGITKARVAVWSTTGGKDDKKWYTMKKNTDGSWKATIQAGYLKHYGECNVKCFTGSTFLDEGTFTVTKDEYLASKNTILVGGSGYTRTIRLIHPSGIKTLRAAVWSKEGGQDDIKWYTMEKQSDGTWLATISTMALSHSGTCYVHVYANEDDFIGNKTFSCKLTDLGIQWDSSWEFAGYSKIHTGTAKLYRATKNRKGIVVGVNAGHGTILPSGQDNYVYSHPDHTPKVTGGSTQAGEVWTICDNTGMTFSDGTPEAAVTLQEAVIFRDLLLEAGYDVIMIREDNDSGLDVIARTVICNELADCHISIHWDGDGLGYDKGIFYMSVPDALKSMYPTSTIWSESNRLGDCVIQGMKKKGLTVFEGGSMQMDLMQTSYSKVPSIDIELGNQSSSHTTSDLTKRAEAMLAGLDIFFGE